MHSKVDATYISLREKILFGELKAGSPMTFEHIVDLTDVSASMARELILSLSAGGYLTRRGRGHIVSTFSKKQVEEWRIALGGIVEIGALRLALVGGEQLDRAAQFLDGNVRNVSVEDEAFFLGAVAFTTIVLGGRESSLSQIVEQFIPQAFFRLQWLSDAYADRTGYLVEASDRYLAAARRGDLDGVRDASRYFFDSTAPALHKLVDEMAAGSFPRNDKRDALHTIEPKITGSPTYAGSSRALTPLMSSLSEAQLTAHTFQ
ncbi:MAG: GntR family transcriptional regulator [Pseudomonadota bacterium]